MKRGDLHSEGGFTLVEVIVVVAIISVIGTVLTGALILGLGTVNEDATNIQASGDAKLLLTYFPADVRTLSPPTDPSVQCGTGDEKATFEDGTASPPVIVRYAVQTDGQRRLTRTTCVGAQVRVQTLVSSVTSVEPTAEPPDAAPGQIRILKLTVTVPDGCSMPAASQCPPYTYQVSGTKRS